MIIRTVLTIGFGAGVFWLVWGKYGVGWGLLYGVFWQTWLGYRVADYLLR